MNLGLRDRGIQGFDVKSKVPKSSSPKFRLFEIEIVWDDPPKLAAQAEVGPQAAQDPGKAYPGTRMPVVIGSGSHPFPFRTRKLSLIPPMVLHGKLCGRVGRCRQ